MNTEVPNKKINRRRRRPPRSADRRPAEREAERGPERPAERPPEKRAERSPDRPGPEPSARRGQDSQTPIRQRSEPRRRPARAGGDSSPQGNDFLPELTKANRGPAEPPISSLNPDIFIYTYTLRPKSLLESYQPGPTNTERMQYENTTTL